MGLLCSSFILEPVSHGNQKKKKKKLNYFSQSSTLATGNEVGLRLNFWIWKLPLTNLKTMVELPTWSAILPLHPRLRLAIFIADVFHTAANASSVIFNLCQQFFANAKIFELERLNRQFYSVHLHGHIRNNRCNIKIDIFLLPAKKSNTRDKTPTLFFKNKIFITRPRKEQKRNVLASRSFLG